MEQVAKSAGKQIAQEITSIAHYDIVNALQNDLVDKNQLFLIIKKKITDFIKKVENFENIHANNNRSIYHELARLRDEKQMIYAEFFEIQNLINLYSNQKIVMTYVHIDPESGQREIRIFDNTAEHLGITSGMTWNGNPFYKLGYEVDSHYQILQNALSQEENNELQDTAIEIERRYDKYKKRVLWKYEIWKGYSFRNKGPINEAFVNFYVHDVKLKKGMEGNIDTFLLDETYGAINADNTKGFMIGDVQKGDIHYAVKGAFGSPQGTKEVIKDFKKLLAEDFNEEVFKEFIYKYTIEEANKQYKSHISEMSARSINMILNRTAKDLKELIEK